MHIFFRSAKAGSYLKPRSYLPRFWRTISSYDRCQWLHNWLSTFPRTDRKRPHHWWRFKYTLQGRKPLFYHRTRISCVVWAVKYFRPFPFGRKLKLMTDHRPLTRLSFIKDPGSSFAPWRLKLEANDYEIKFMIMTTSTNPKCYKRSLKNLKHSSNDIKRFPGSTITKYNLLTVNSLKVKINTY